MNTDRLEETIEVAMWNVDPEMTNALRKVYSEALAEAVRREHCVKEHRYHTYYEINTKAKLPKENDFCYDCNKPKADEVKE